MIGRSSSGNSVCVYPCRTVFGRVQVAGELNKNQMLSVAFWSAAASSAGIALQQSHPRFQIKNRVCCALKMALCAWPRLSN